MPSRRLGDTASDFQQQSSGGLISFHQWQHGDDVAAVPWLQDPA